MKKNILNYDTFLNEGYTPSTVSADVFNTPGMGNVTVGGTKAVAMFYLGDKDKIHERGQKDDSWMRPSGDYTNRNWLVPNYENYQNQRQSMARFQIGQAVRCVNTLHEANGKIGKIIAFEDNTVRWELASSETGIGQGSRQYRCQAQDLELVQ